jgi:hypothetical protein
MDSKEAAIKEEYHRVHLCASLSLVIGACFVTHHIFRVFVGICGSVQASSWSEVPKELIEYVC